MDFHLPVMYQLYQFRDGYRYFLAEDNKSFYCVKSVCIRKFALREIDAHSSL